MSPLVALFLVQIDAKTARREIQARYDALDRGFRKMDPTVLDGLMTDDFAGTSPNGHPINRKLALTTFRGMMLSGDLQTWPRKVTKLRLDGSDAVATVEGHYTTAMKSPGGKPSRFELLSTVEDTWTRQAGAWRICRSKTLRMRMLSDGKDVSPGH